MKKIFNKILSITNSVFYIDINFLGIKLHKKKILSNNEKTIYENLPINKTKIFLNTNSGSYSDNQKYIAQELLKENNFEIIWGGNEKTTNYIKDFPDKIKVIPFTSKKYLREMATSKFLIFQDRRLNEIKSHIRKKDSQIYIQTWHGSLGIKKTGEERNDVNNKHFEECKIDAKEIDFLTSNGTYTTNFFKQAFWNNGEILEFGHPRNDIFFQNRPDIREKVYNYFSIPKNKKIALYVPTLREDHSLNSYNMNFEEIKNSLKNKFNNEWVILMKLHPLIIELWDNYKYKKNVINATNYSDIQELLYCADIVFTDYSSCVFDFILSKKPAFIYATDIDNYKNGRGLQYPLEDTPFLIATNNDELIKNIENFDNDKYQTKVEEFLKEKGCIDDGHASERVVKLIKEIINGI